MDFLWISNRLLPFRTSTVWLCCMALAGAMLTRAYGQGTRKDLLFPDNPDYSNLSEKGKQLFDGLTNNRRASIETIIVRMRPIAEVLSDNRMTITIPGRGEQYEVYVKNIEYSDAEKPDFCASGISSTTQLRPESDPDKHGRMPGVMQR